ncbi:MAG: TerC family protein, partial [Actinobacteria bacterium]|nr:TerC family protein [Actinomycetota bacterium]
MNVDIWVWVATFLILVTVLAVDFIYQVRNPHEPTFRESAIQSAIYIILALLFTFVVGGIWGPQFAQEYFAGYITEKSLSVDNVFVFLVIFTQFAVPRELRSQALLIGVGLALVLRFIFILLGAAFIENFSWAFYVFGAFLLFTALKLLKDTYDGLKEGGHNDYAGGKLISTIQKFIPATDKYHGNKMVIKVSGKRLATPLLMVMIAIGFTDLLFALDSIPA